MSSGQFSNRNDQFDLFDENFDINEFIDETLDIIRSHSETISTDSGIISGTILRRTDEQSNSNLTSDALAAQPMNHGDDSSKDQNFEISVLKPISEQNAQTELNKPLNQYNNTVNNENTTLLMTHGYESSRTQNLDNVVFEPVTDPNQEQNLGHFGTASVDSGFVSDALRKKKEKAKSNCSNQVLTNQTLTHENDSFDAPNMDFLVPYPICQSEDEISTEQSNRNRVCQICYHINEPRMTKTLLSALPRSLGTRGCMCGPIHTCGLHPEQKQTIHADCLTNKTKRIRYRLRKFKKY